MNEDIQFLKELQKEMNDQENDGQAAPRFWTIMDYKWEVTGEDYAERVRLFDNHACEPLEIEDYLEDVKERFEDGDFTDEEVEELELEIDLDNLDEVVNWIENHDDDSRYYAIYETEVSFVAWNTLFFTKEEAQKHLEGNSHHYSSKAHTFAMTAWRAPKMERLIKILETFDWSSIDQKIKS